MVKEFKEYEKSMKQKGINTDSVTIDKKDGEESSEEEVKEKKKYLTINETLA